MTTYAAFRKEAVRLTGGRPITNFTAWSGLILRADLKAQGWVEPNFKVLVFDGRRQELARYPNRDVGDMNGGVWAHAAGQRYSMYQDSPDDTAYHAQNQHLDYWQRNVPRLTRTLRLAAGDRRDWKSWEYAEVSIFPRFNWSHYLIGIESVDAQQGVLRLKARCFYEIRPGDRYFVRNLLEELDAPGEWFLDRHGAAVYFWPPVAMGSGPVEAAGVGSIVLVIGAGVPEEWLNNPIRVKGLRVREGLVDWEWDGSLVEVYFCGKPLEVELGAAFPADTPESV